MATMVRNGAEINIKWMFTLSLLFHLFVLFAISSSLFSIFDFSKRVYTPPPAIQVSIVEMARERPLERPVAVEQKAEVRSKKQDTVKQKVETRIQKVNPVMPEPVATEKTEPRGNAQHQEARPGAGTEKPVVAEEARLTPAVPAISGPTVDVPDFKYDYYLGMIRNKVESRWNQPVAYSQVKQTLVEFTIRRSGDIDNIRVSESSGDRYYDQTALRAVSLSNPFPPLPRGYKEGSLKVRYRFIFGGKRG